MGADLLLRLGTIEVVETPGVTDMSAFEDTLDRPPIHSFPRDPRYRRSGALVPQIGDIAYCGYVKDTPTVGPLDPRTPITCDPCARLRRIVEGR